MMVFLILAGRPYIAHSERVKIVRISPPQENIAEHLSAYAPGVVIILDKWYCCDLAKGLIKEAHDLTKMINFINSNANISKQKIIELTKMAREIIDLDKKYNNDPLKFWANKEGYTFGEKKERYLNPPMGKSEKVNWKGCYTWKELLFAQKMCVRTARKFLKKLQGINITTK